jgi:hypothetical protein
VYPDSQSDKVSNSSGLKIHSRVSTIDDEVKLEDRIKPTSTYSEYDIQLSIDLNKWLLQRALFL